jgi:hypothetical protein
VPGTRGGGSVLCLTLVPGGWLWWLCLCRKAEPAATHGSEAFHDGGCVGTGQLTGGVAQCADAVGQQCLAAFIVTVGLRRTVQELPAGLFKLRFQFAVAREGNGVTSR